MIMHAFLMGVGVIWVLAISPEAKTYDGTPQPTADEYQIVQPVPPPCVISHIERHGALDYEVYCE